MKPLDPRLLRHARAARGYVLLTAGTGIVTAALVVAQALLIASIVAPAVTSARPLGAALPLVGALAAVVAARAIVVGIQERYAHRAATRVIVDLRTQVVERAVELGPRWLSSGRGPATVTLVTRGLDDLEPYFVRYLPQLLLAATLTPATLVVIGVLEWVSALIIVVTIPLVPLFMILVGQLTKGTAERRLATMQRLGSQVLDLVAGIPTLQAFGRQVGPGARVRALGEAHRRTTMGTLRIAFLSGMVLELLTTLSVAVVAVGIGLRLVDGNLDLFTGLAVLILAPEVYLPLRQVGLHFHASTNGVAAAEKAFEVLDAPAPGAPAHDSRARVPAPRWGAGAGLVLEGVGVRAPGRDLMAPADLDATVQAGRITALTGPNGAGKSTTVLVLLGLLRPDTGRVLMRGGAPRDPSGSGAGEPRDGDLRAVDLQDVDLQDVDPATWHEQISWVPQRSRLAPGTLASAVLGDTALPVTDPRVRRAAQLTGLDLVAQALPDGWRTPVGQGGYGLSLGQRQRVALTSALVGDRPIVILDEPTAHLDAVSEEQILAALTALRDEGRTVVVVAHRPGLLAIADDVVHVASRGLVPAAAAGTRDDAVEGGLGGPVPGDRVPKASAGSGSAPERAR